MKTKIELPKIDYNGIGRKINAVTIDVKLKETEKGKVFTMSAGVWDSKRDDMLCCGQMCDELPELYPNNKLVKRLVEIWGKYHLNDMNAGTERQEQALYNAGKDKADYTEQCEYLKSIGLYFDGNYEYGSAWLFRPIPENIIEEIEKIILNNN